MMATEYRIVCSQHKKSGHRSHRYPIAGKNPAERARQRVIDLNHEAELIRNEKGWSDPRGREAPWTVQTREVTKWEDNDE